MMQYKQQEAISQGHGNHGLWSWQSLYKITCTSFERSPFTASDSPRTPPRTILFDFLFEGHIMDTEASGKKMWGRREFWGISQEFDPDWCMTDEERKLQKEVMELCRTTIRPHAILCDKTYTYPRKSMDALAELGLLGLMIPKELGGLGASHQCATIIVETIARYGCPSTCLVYVMHVSSTAALAYRYHNNKTISDLLRRINSEKLIGTLAYSDPTTGGHFWFPLSSKTKEYTDGRVKVLKCGSWCTSSGFADYYVIQTASSRSRLDYSQLDVYLVYKDEIRASSSDWSSLGMHGNQSGPIICDTVLTPDRRVGPIGDGAKSNDECIDPFFYLLSASGWNGIAMSAIDIAKKHATRKSHADTGLRVADYPTIQDYFGESLTSTNACRLQVLSVSQCLDKHTDNNDWKLYADLDFGPRQRKLHWLMQCKFQAAKNVDHVTDVMLHACGGSGYKTDLGLERIVRDAKAGWVMGPSNEVIRQFVGKMCLFGIDILDYWEQKVNRGVLVHEIQKMTVDEKKELAQRLLKDVDKSSTDSSKLTEDDFLDESNEYLFDNPFNTSKPKYNEETVLENGAKHQPGLHPEEYRPLKFIEKIMLTEDTFVFKFALPDETDHSGCLIGQYIQMRVNVPGSKPQERYFSPTSVPNKYGTIEIATRLLAQGSFSVRLATMKPGDTIEARGPCGGYEYLPNTLDHVTLICGGAGVTPAVQVIRAICGDDEDKTKVTLLFAAETIDKLLFREELANAMKSDRRIKVVMCVGEAECDWDGEEGLIDTKMLQRHLLNPDEKTKNKIIMCGGPLMTTNMLHSLRDLEYPSENIFIYGQFGTSQIHMVYGRNSDLSSHDG